MESKKSNGSSKILDLFELKSSEIEIRSEMINQQSRRGRKVGQLEETNDGFTRLRFPVAIFVA